MAAGLGWDGGRSRAGPLARLLVRQIDRLLIEDLRRHKADPGQHRLHRLVGRAGAEHHAVELFPAAKIEHGFGQLVGRAGAALRRADKDAVEVGVGFLGDEILPLADIGPADRIGAVVGDEGRRVLVVDQLA